MVAMLDAEIKHSEAWRKMLTAPGILDPASAIMQMAKRAHVSDQAPQLKPFQQLLAPLWRARRLQPTLVLTEETIEAVKNAEEMAQYDPTSTSMVARQLIHVQTSTTSTVSASRLRIALGNLLRHNVPLAGMKDELRAVSTMEPHEFWHRTVARGGRDENLAELVAERTMSNWHVPRQAPRGRSASAEANGRQGRQKRRTPAAGATHGYDGWAT